MKLLHPKVFRLAAEIMMKRSEWTPIGCCSAINMAVDKIIGNVENLSDIKKLHRDFFRTYFLPDFTEFMAFPPDETGSVYWWGNLAPKNQICRINALLLAEHLAVADHIQLVNVKWGQR